MPEKILSIDIGGSKIKGAVLDASGNLIHEYIKLSTPNPCTPQQAIDTIQQLVQGLEFDKIACGFPGYVRDGIVFTAPNLGNEYWNKIPFEQMLSKAFHKPARIANDADMLGLGVIKGTGFEMMVTLGTGFGTAFYLNGKLLPHLEIAHHPIRDNETYDEYVGNKALEYIGVVRWNDRMEYVLKILKTVFNYDTLYLGGGNAKKIHFPLESGIVKVTNLEGIDGGVKLWQQ